MEHRVTKLETSFEAMTEDMTTLMLGQHEIQRKLDTVLITMAETRGAAKLGKAIYSLFVAGIGLIGGILGGNIGPHIR